MIMVSLPILTTSHLNSDVEDSNSNTGSKVSQRTEYFTTASNLLKSGADAVERLMSSYKEIVELAGYTSRVSELFQVFDDVSHGVYKKTTVDDETATAGILEFKNGQPVANGERSEINKSHSILMKFLNFLGKIFYDTENMSITLKSVPVVTPNCDIVVPNLTLTIKPGMHLLITGPNGCGKSR